MHRLIQLAAHFLKEEDGPTAFEYAVMLALVVAVCVALVNSIGATSSQHFSNPSLKTAAGS